MSFVNEGNRKLFTIIFHRENQICIWTPACNYRVCCKATGNDALSVFASVVNRFWHHSGKSVQSNNKVTHQVGCLKNSTSHFLAWIFHSQSLADCQNISFKVSSRKKKKCVVSFHFYVYSTYPRDMCGCFFGVQIGFRNLPTILRSVNKTDFHVCFCSSRLSYKLVIAL